jgi:glycosyltransferase involved in cell wall biosynthesis
MEYVEGAIESVLAQTYEDLELVVVNDGSTDGTREVLQEYEDDNRVQVVNCEENGGVAAARNRGVARARGEFICSFDDDDRWHPEKVEKQVRLMDELDDRYALVYTWGETKRDGETIHLHDNNRVGDIYPEVLGEYALLPHSSHMLRKSHLEAVGEYDTDLTSTEDHDMCIRLAKRYRFECIPEVTVSRTVHDDNISLQPEHVESCRKLLEKYRTELHHYPALERKLEAGWRDKAALAAVGRDDRTAARRYSRAAFRYEPTVLRAQIAALMTVGPEAYRLASRVKRRLADS